jgi:hypothetical protein
MAHNAGRPKHAQLFEPLYRRQSMPPGDLVKLGKRLCRVGLPAEPSLVCLSVARLEEFGRAGIDLGGANHSGDTSRGVFFGVLQKLERLFHRAKTLIREPIIFNDVAVLGEPARRPKHRRDTRADSAFGKRVDPVWIGNCEIDNGRDTGRQQFGGSKARLPRSSLFISYHRGHEFVQVRIIEPPRSCFVRISLVDGLMRQVAMDVYEARNDQHSAAIDRLVGCADVCLVIAPDVNNTVGLKYQISVFEIAVA